MTTIDIRGAQQRGLVSVIGRPSWTRMKDDHQKVSVRLKLRLTLEGKDDADLWASHYFPGADRMFQRVTVEGTTEQWPAVWYKGEVELFVNFHDATVGEAPYAGGACLARKVVLHMTSKSQHVDMELEFKGVVADEVGSFALASVAPTEVSVSNAQVDLFAGKDAA